RIHDAVLEAIRKGIVNSAIDISDGGLAIALAEACIKNPSGPMGASVYLSGDARNDELLFSECQSCIVVTVREDNLLEMEKIASKNMVPSTTIGRVKGDRRLRINTLIDIDTAVLLREYTAAIPSMMKGG
ncbi:MAG: phosphoribosylformylglycinamidine synthase II, partial [Candidatus Neomarinimicrobiota bacterium]